MNQEYDTVIVGGGPSGLALAQCLSRLSLKIVVVDPEFGGCHRVRRVGGKFTEHGPRVYSSTYATFRMLLRDLGSDFHEWFVPYRFNIASIGQETVFSTLTWRELMVLGTSFFGLVHPGFGANETMAAYMQRHRFGSESRDIIERLCRLTDGAGSEKYTVREFLQLFNVQSIYNLYQPRTPNDTGLVGFWIDRLRRRGVEFVRSEVTEVIPSGVILDNSKVILGKRVVLAIPPLSLVELLGRSTLLTNAFGNYKDLKNWAEKTAYIDYLSFSLHWKNKLALPKVYGFPRSDWGIAFIVLSDYMTHVDGTLISVAVTLPERKSQWTNKTAYESTLAELRSEILRQLRLAFPDLPSPAAFLKSPGVVPTTRGWTSLDTAFISTANASYLLPQSRTVPNLYSLGTHNGRSKYPFTSLESAVSNAVMLAVEMEPKLASSFGVKRTWTVMDLISFFISTLIIVFLFKRYRFTR